MQMLIQILALLAILAGTAFSVVGALGFMRLGDVYGRLHAAGKVSVFGVILLLVAAMLLTPLSLGNSLVFIVLLLIAGPVGAHALASAAYRIGIPMAHSVQDDLATDLYEADIQGGPAPPDDQSP
jgi:multicomponent Na+:H+ antiporter subunit G